MFVFTFKYKNIYVCLFYNMNLMLKCFLSWGGGYLKLSGSALDCRSPDQAIDPPGA